MSLISIGPGLKYFYFVINKASAYCVLAVTAFIITVTFNMQNLTRTKQQLQQQQQKQS